MPPHPRELEESITRIAAVDAARVVIDGDRITEVHVIAAPEKPAKQVVRDVQSLAMARFGTSIDRRIISVVQIAPDKVRATAPVRPAVMAIDADANGAKTNVRVTLRYAEVEHVGESSGPSVASARLRLVAEATINAVERTFAEAGPMALDSVTAVPVGNHTAVVAVVIGAASDGTERVTVGSALGDDDTEKAAVRAVLDALNRRLIDRRS